jgi:hypothetical protein
MSPRDVTGKCALKIMVKHTNNGTIIQWEWQFLHKSNQQSKSQTPVYKN